ncbi:phage portal protein [Streptomyces atriruber]|uniref:phage portal protein n=1 Tax=Streptomyces atriruber TaxID=545121 RepID=UPI0006E28A9C|nr:phage portal protein [Streptomyces atriruber]
MAKLWRSLLRSGEARSSDPPLSMQSWADLLNYNGLAYGFGTVTTSADTEAISNDFRAYSEGLYKANGIVFACMTVRAHVFSEARFQYQRMKNGRPGDLFGTKELALLETPWPNGTTGELLSRAMQDVDLCGNHYVVREAGRLRRLRPDWVQIVLTAPPDQAVQSDVAGYVYYPGGIGNGQGKVYLPEELAHWSPIPDPDAQYRGMSWLTPVIRDIQSDKAATTHKANFFANAATPNLAVSFKETVTKEQFKDFMAAMDAAHSGVDNAYKTLYLGGGADVRVVGADLKQLDFRATQGAGEVRIAAAARVHPTLVGLSDSLSGSSLNAGNYSVARDWFGSGTMRPLWRSISAAYQTLVPAITGTRLWYDDRDIPALRADKKDLAEIQTTQSATITSLITAGFTPESAVAAVMAEDWALLVHSGLLSVQLTPPGESDEPVALPEPVTAPAEGN